MKYIKQMFLLLLVFFSALIFGRFMIKYNLLDKLALNSSSSAHFVPLDPKFFQTMKDRIVFYKLKNGLEVALLPDPSAHKVFMQMAYRVGSANETSKTRGMAHLLEHMLFKGTKEMSECDLPKIAFKYGARLNAYTDYDYTVYFFEVDNANYEPFLDILADCMCNSTIGEQQLASELKAVVQELNMYKDDPFDQMFNELTKRLFPGNHPYANPVIGYVQELAALKAEVLRKFYKKFYHPANATLFVIGNFDKNRIKDEIEAKFGSIENTGPRAEPMFPPLIKTPEKIKVQMVQNVSSPTIQMLWITSGLNDLKNFACRQLLSLALVSGKSGRLYKRLVQDQALATFIKADDPAKVIQTYKHAGFFEICLATDPSKVDQCISEIGKELELIIQSGLTKSELEQCKAQLATTMVNAMEDSYSTGFNLLAFYWKCFYFATNDINAFFNYQSILASVTSQDVALFVKEQINPMFSNVAVSMPINDQTKELYHQQQVSLKEEDAKVLAAHQRTTVVQEPKKFFTVPDVVPLDFHMPKPKFDKVLPNGLRVVGVNVKTAPSVSCVLASKHSKWMSNLLDIEPSIGASGLLPGALESLKCALAAHLLAKNSVNFTKDQNEQFLKTLGAQAEFKTNQASLYVTSSNFWQAFERFAHIAFHPKFSTADLQVEQKISSSLIERHETSNGSLVFNLYYQKAYSGTDFAWTLDQAINLVKNTTVSDLEACHKEFYNPKNLVLVISGDLPEDLVANPEVLSKFLNTQNQAKVLQAYHVPTPEIIGEDVIRHPMPSDQQFMFMARPAIGLSEQITSIDVIKSVFSTVILSGMGSKIWALREQTGLFYSASGCFSGQVKKGWRCAGAPLDTIWAIVNPANSMILRDKIIQMLDQASKQEFDAQTLDGMKQSYLNGLIMTSTSNKLLAKTFADLIVLELGFDFFDKSWKTVSEVTNETLQSLSKEICNVNNMATFLVGGQD